jgi:hypothetical protein
MTNILKNATLCTIHLRAPDIAALDIQHAKLNNSIKFH